MFKLSLKIVLLFIAIIVVITASSLVLKNVDNILIKSAIPFMLIILVVAILYWKNETKVSLKLSSSIQNKIIVIPAMLLLFAYSAWASDGFVAKTNSTSFVLGLAVVIYLQTFWEELIFRGILLNHYLKNDVSINKSIIYSSVIFAVVHLINVLSNPSVESVINQVIVAVALGVFLGALYMASRNIYIAGLAHALINYPSYSNKYQNDTYLAPNVSHELVESTPVLESVFGFVMLLLFYSPFLIVGLAFLKKVKIDLSKTPLTLTTEYAFRLFRLKN